MQHNHVTPGGSCLGKPDISYPCRWEYTIIGSGSERLTAIVIDACAPAQPTITVSGTSSGGKYHSIRAALEVADEAMRRAIYERLCNHPDVKVVL